ncbi:MAG: hypothetical protein A3C84_04270 [Candidatus Ryanbacteria bacterium RIFCSPHIGHO2_02_FULL_48_12]|uniref:DUF5667 domain-containing protein n=1 Tax=Candidatus Ryanbacteria bacterium RIFCSPHIGHO2_01_FULL_48_27 TaxID=1802115 RepID=A0A1G2G6C0_9BACT|nr:MAG: hypothetical protein A2756_00685 [Candidatus Ryanbacteria bacterium RIFCSPHIGHO2_01_FULL_48_27]OGZ48579.1 MAG: hypothetical protein A3C84_04270 [Candidatus Ryanbacteria bacterium RIFCSPHIGHO2_02_FULL_48_12]
MAIIVAIIVLVSAGVSFTAQSTLPGDMLYPVKTEVNERAEGWFAVSSESESRHQATLVLRRLEEAEKLKTQGRLDAETKAELESEFKLHMSEAEREMDDLEASGKAKEATAMRASLKALVHARGGALGIIDLDGSLGAEIKIEGEDERQNEDDDREDKEDPDEDSNNNSNDDRDDESGKDMEAEVVTSQGNLKLEYETGSLRLTGKLTRSTPCVDWQYQTTATKDFPSSSVVFNLTKKSTAEICIQVLGEPQEIEIKVPNVSPSANIKVNVESKMVFDGKLK